MENTKQLICPHCGKKVLILGETKLFILKLLKKHEGISIRELWRLSNKMIAYKNMWAQVTHLSSMGLVNIKKIDMYNGSIITLPK